MIFNSIETVLVIVLLLSVGVYLSKKGFMTKEDKPFLTKLIINISIPSITIYNFFTSVERELIFKSYKLLLIPLITMIISFLIGNILYKILKIDRKKRGSFIAMCSVSNSLFIGMPVCIGLFGEQSIAYVIFYYIVNTLFFWGVCIPNVRRDGGALSGGIRDIFTPPLVTVLISMVLVIMGVKLPNLILKTVKYLGSMSTPLSLIFIGGVIYNIGFKNIKIDRSIVAVTLMRFLIAPLITFIIAYKLNVNKMATQVFTIQSAMPVIMQVAVVADAYNVDSDYVSTAVAVTTIFSLVSIPFYMYFMTKVI